MRDQAAASTPSTSMDKIGAMILLTPGPTPIPDSVVRAIARPIIPHRSPAFEEIYAQCRIGLQKIYRTQSPVVTLVGSGTCAMESAIWSLARPGSTIVACASGKFGERWQQVADRVAQAMSGETLPISSPWGEPISPDQLAAGLRSTSNVGAVVFVHCETSTTTLSDAAALAKVARTYAPDAMVIADGITSVGALPVEPDKWGLDAVACASQKAFGLPPGLSFVSVSERAVSQLNYNPDSSTPMYLDLRKYLRADEQGTTPFTPSVNLFYGLQESLRLITAISIEEQWRRTAKRATAVRNALTAMGLQLASSSPSDSVTAVFIDKINADTVRKWCLTNRDVALAGGQDDWKGRAIRMSHMGFVTDCETVAGVSAIADAHDALAPGAYDTRAGVETITQELPDLEPTQ
jgi:aspartate aminotransferase-like enzyme